MNFTPQVWQAINVIKKTYGDDVDVALKSKNLFKFGRHTATGTGFETLSEFPGTETEETLVSGNDITSIISSSASDTEPMTIEGHVLEANGDTTFVVQQATLTGQTAVLLDTPLFRVSRFYNDNGSPLVGDVFVYEGGATTSGVPDVDSSVHALITAGNQQTQKCQTTISSVDYYILTSSNISLNKKVAGYADAYLETKPTGSSVWRPNMPNFSASSSGGVSTVNLDPCIIIPKNHDVRLQVRCGAINDEASGGFNGYLAKIT